MKNKIYLIRHGETDWNRSDKLQGHSDIELNDLGRDQATRLGLFTTTLDVDHVISSDLKRAHETASLAFPRHTPIQNRDPRLREVHLGQAEGAQRSRLAEDFGPEIAKAWFATDAESMLARFPGGESRSEAVLRLRSALVDWSLRYPNKNLAFITHGLLMRSFAQSLLGFYRPEFRAPNCAIFEFHRSQSGINTEIKMAQIYWALEENSI